MEALPDDLIDSILAQAATRKSTRSTKPKLNDPASRDIMVWIHLNHTFATCANKECPDEREQKVTEGKAMCTDLGGSVMVCRLCFLSGYGLDKGAGSV